MKVLFTCLLFLLCFFCLFDTQLVQAGTYSQERGPKPEQIFCQEVMSLFNSSSTKSDELAAADQCKSSSVQCALPGISCSSQKISSINWKGLGLTSVPPSTWTLSNLRSVDISFNPLSSLTADDSVEAPIRFLSISDCQFTQFPTLITSLGSLKSLYMSGNTVPEIPSSIWELDDLRTLDVSNNPLTTLPDLPGTRSEVELSDVKMDQCSMSDYPPVLAKCGSLVNVSLSHNQLTSLSSSEIPQSLSLLDLSYNKLREFPFNKYSVEQLILDHNCFDCDLFPQDLPCESSEQEECSEPSGSSAGLSSSSSDIDDQSQNSSECGSSQDSDSSIKSSSTHGVGNSSTSSVFSSFSEGRSNSTGDETVSTDSSSAGSAGGSLVWVYVTVPICGFVLVAVVVLAVAFRHKIGKRRPEELSIVVDGEQQAFSLTKEIGKGSFGTVWLAQSDSLTLAAKEMARRTDESENEYKKEMEIMSHLDSPYVVRVYGSVVTDESYFIAMEFVPLGSLSVVTKNYYFSPFMRSRFMLDVARGMEYLHGRGVIHRDLKPANVLVSSIDPESEVLCKITDFGASRQGLEDTNTMTMTCGIGSPYYMSPEMLRGDQKYTRAVDVYSFGIMGAELWNQKQPFSEVHFDTPFAFARYVLEGHRPAVQSDCPRGLSKLFSLCWEADRLDRPQFSSLVKDLEPIVERLKKTTPEGTDHVTVREDAEGCELPGTKEPRTKTKTRTAKSATVKERKSPEKKKKKKNKHHNSTEKSQDSPTRPLADESSVSISPAVPATPVSPSVATPATPSTASPPEDTAVEIPLEDLSDSKLVCSDNL